MGKQKLRDIVFTSPQVCMDYVLSGKAEFQLRSEITAKYLAFRVEAANEGIWWVSHRPDGEELWQLAAEISYGGLEAMGGSDPVEPRAFAAFGYFWRALVLGRFADDLEAVHTNQCGRCHARLKPTELEIGFDRLCAARVRAVTACRQGRRFICEPAPRRSPRSLPPMVRVPNRIPVGLFQMQAA